MAPPRRSAPAAPAAPVAPAAATWQEQALTACNSALAAEGCALRIERRGARLGLRGPLPARDGGGALVVQRISLGLPSTPAGLAEASARLAEVRQQLQQGNFRWESWSRRRAASVPSASAAGLRTGMALVKGRGSLEDPGLGPGLEGTGLRQQIEAFAQAFRADPRRRRQPAGSRSTWSGAYLPYLRRLLRHPAADSNAAALTPELLETVLESFEPGSRSRQQCGLVFGALARQQGLPMPSDWSDRSGGYGLHAARFRRLPSDAQILALVERIPNPAWRLAYGLMATYGLRNHEVFFCDLSALAPGGDRVLRVLPASKTGEHQVWPFQPEWVEHFGLERLGVEPEALPPVDTDLRRTTLRQAGRRVAEQFHRYGLPITPYDLRHAWAVRTIHIGLPDTVSARMMGHSVAIHTRTYHHWITRRDQQQAVDAALARRGAA